jgi:hypothetical protein
MKRLKLDIQRFGGIYSVRASVVSQDIQNNRSTIRITATSTTNGDTRNYTWDAYIQGSYSGEASGNLSRQYVYLPYNSSYSVLWDIPVRHNDDGTCGEININCYHYITDNTNGYSSTSITPPTIPRYATCNQSINAITETSITMDWSSDSTCDYLWYSTNNGSSWTAVGSINATGGSYTISGLSPETQYNVKTRVRRKDSQLTTDSYMTGITTYNYPTLGGGANLKLGEMPLLLQMNNPIKRPLTITILTETNQPVKTITTDGTNNTLSITLTNAEEDIFYASIPNKKEGTYKIRTESSVNTNTKDGRQYIINENDSKPTFNDFTYADTNATTVALTGNNQIVVQGYSNIQATISVSNKAVANKGASMNTGRYDLIITGNNTNSESYSDNSDVVITTNGANSGSIKVSAVDSRNLATEVPKTATVKDYTNIQKGNINIVRTGNVGTECTLSYDGTLWGQSFGNITNTVKSARYRYKKTSDANWPATWNGITPITPTTTNNNYSFSNIIAGDLGNSGFSTEYSFNVQVEVFDELSSTVFSFTLGTGIPHIAIDDDGVAIKQPYDTSDDSVLQVNGSETIKKAIKIPKNATAGYGLTNSDGDSIVRDWNNRNVTVDATGGGLYLGFQNTSFINFLNGTAGLDSNGFTANKINGFAWDYSTENTTDTWVPVSTGDGKWQHKVLPSKLTEKLDYFNDTSGTDVKELLRNKISQVQTQLNGVGNGMMFLNGGWAGVNYCFGIGSKVGVVIQVICFFNDNIFYARYDGGGYSYTVWNGTMF